MQNSEEDRRGMFLIFLSAVLWSFFPIITILSFVSLPPLMSAGLSALFAALFFALWIAWKGNWKGLHVIHAWTDLFWAIFLIGVVFYGLMFVAIQRTTAGNASIFALMEIFWAMGILRLFKGERVTSMQVGGMVLAVFGAVIILYQDGIHVNTGNLLIILATLFPPLGNYYAKRAVKKVGSVALMFYRSVVSGALLMTASLIWEPAVSLGDISLSVPFLLINGIVLFGISKILWLEGLKHTMVSKGTGLLTVEPAFTLLFAFLLLGEVPTIWQMAGLVPIAAGVWLLTGVKVRGRG